MKPTLFRVATKMAALLKSSVFLRQRCVGVLTSMDSRGMELDRQESQETAKLKAQVIKFVSFRDVN